MKIHIDLDLGNGAYQIGKDIPLLDAFVLPRSVINNSLIEKVQKDGRHNFDYFLLDINESRISKRMIYIGETTDLISRISGHKKKKQWWNTMVVFSRNILSEYDVKAVERLLIEAYEDSDMYRVDNDQGSKKPFDDYHQQYVDYIIDIMNFLSYGITTSVINEEGDKKPNVPVEKPVDVNSRRGKFKFSLIGLKPGDKVTLENSDREFEICDDERVLYEGKPIKLSPLAEKLLTNRKPPLQGPKYFRYNGEALADIRDRFEGIIVDSVAKTNNWIVACNKNYFDIDKAFSTVKVIDYKQTANISAGSRVYLYVSTPDKAISYECEAVVVNKPAQTIDDSAFVLDKDGFSDCNRFMELKLVRKLNPEGLGLSDLKEHGLTSTLQSPCRTSVDLQKYIDQVTGTNK